MERKGKAPGDLLRIVKQGELPGYQEISAYLQAMSLKRLFRQGWLRAGLPKEACESVADHCFGCFFLAFLLAPREDPPVSAEKAAIMALLHELGEIHSGDITPHDGVSPEEKRRRELESVERFLSLLEGAGSSERILSIWTEYEEGRSPEARFVKRVDRLEMALQAAVYAAEGMEGSEDFISSALESVRGSSFEKIIDSLWGKA
jgi:putative hydrolases of HD superfamily